MTFCHSTESARNLNPDSSEFRIFGLVKMDFTSNPQSEQKLREVIAQQQESIERLQNIVRQSLLPNRISYSKHIQFIELSFNGPGLVKIE